MTKSRLLVHALSCSLVLHVACDSGSKKEASPKAAKAGDAKAGDAKAGDAKAGDAKANPHANPHGDQPPNPHAGMAMPPGAGAKTEPGPPRDIEVSGEMVEANVRGLGLSVPKEWEKGTPTSSMRAAQWVMPGPGGDGELVVYRFPGGAGGVQANIDRWKGQFTPPEGKTIDDVSTVETMDGEGGVKTTLVDVTGTYVAAVMPGADAKHNENDYRMFAAAVEGSGDPFYFKAVGPAKTMELWLEPFKKMIGTFQGSGEKPTAIPGTAATPDDGKADDAKADAKADAKPDDKPDDKPDEKKKGG